MQCKFIESYLNLKCFKKNTRNIFVWIYYVNHIEMNTNININ